jgi:L-ascorbate metabolism protein UlaG (beta-lactamase superfamily)
MGTVRSVLARSSAAVVAVRGTITSLGANSRSIRAAGAASTTQGSARFDGRRFCNSEPNVQLSLRAFAGLLRGLVERRGTGRPRRPVPVERPEFPAAAGDLAATWLGHAAVLIEIDGARVLADPMFSRRASPADFAGPRRLHPAPVAAADLPPLDAVLISHDHYDHLDRATIAELVATSDAPFLVPLGVGAHLRTWGVPPARILELDWGDGLDVGALRITCTPARHFSGRLFRRDGTLWASWAIAGPGHRVFFSGDSGYTAAFADIGRRHGPFDLAVLPIGAYADAWPDMHMNPEEAVLAHRDLGGGVLLPIHWATFDLALHSWAEPIERLLRAAATETVATPRPGGRFLPAQPPAVDHWWRAADR